MRFKTRLVLALIVLLLVPPLVGAAGAAEHQAKSATVPAPSDVPLTLDSLPPPNPQDERDRREAALGDHHRGGPLGEAPADVLDEVQPPNPLNTPVTSTAVQLLTNNALGTTATNGVTSHVLEPSVAVRGAEVLYTANWFASFSTDGGATFSYVNPETTFPAIPGQPFCCDQVAIYDQGHDLMIWFLQYVTDANGNTARVAVAQGPDIAAQQWRFYDFTPQGVGNWNNEWFDYPDLALGDDFLYVTTNTFSTGANPTFTRAVILRLPLAEMASYQALNYSFFDTSNNFSLRPTHGATDTMYFGNHVTTASLRVFAWPENSTTLTSTDIGVQPWSNTDRDSRGPDNRPWLGRADPRITAAWLRGGTIGFGWSAARDSNFAQPHVRVALIDTGSMTLAGQPHLWNPGFAYAYPGASVNGSGEVGLSVAFGGGPHHPSHAVGTFDAGSSSWQLATTVNGTHGPSANRWGDYLTVRPDPQNADAWYATGYSLQGGGAGSNIQPRFIRFTADGVVITVDNLSAGTTVSAGTSVTIRATVTDGGTPVQGNTVTFTENSGGALTLTPTSAVTNASGVAETTANVQSNSGQTVTVTGTEAGGMSDTATVDIAANGPDISPYGLALLIAVMLLVAFFYRRRLGRQGGG